MTLNRPDKLNALDLAMCERLSKHCTDRIGLVVMRGAGRCFSAGHHLSDIREGEGMENLIRHCQPVEQLANLPQPVITAADGQCYTGALGLALVVDIIVASSAKFADTHAKWVLTPVWGRSHRLPRHIGPSKAREIVMTSRPMPDAKPLPWGWLTSPYRRALPVDRDKRRRLLGERRHAGRVRPAGADHRRQCHAGICACRTARPL
ncbi:enoyl-CoA hydratase/isomerase family protein [Noviherbaspirillum sp. DKR-6]|uniref:Enoyl-CoA hydratase/isomerase family protein n=1 Tax=Noviherbaspirillum pedocola TaxID=2801341 RepID=A0A934T462_9BURK|nr:enoyl-CoA hydratase/isomerase family protein [Noviherbaspirillum pedocola]